MYRDTLDQNTQNILPESFRFPENEALLSRILAPFKDWKSFVKLPRKDIISAYKELAKAVLESFGVKNKIELDIKRSMHYYGIFLKPSKIVLNHFLIRIKHSVHTIIHECAHAYVHSIRTGEIPFTDKALYNSLCDNYQRFINSRGFHLQPEEIYADLVAYQLLQKHGFSEGYSLPSASPILKIKSAPVKIAVALGEFILTLVLAQLVFLSLIIWKTPFHIKLFFLISFFFALIDMPPKMFWIEDCLKGKSKQKLITKKFDQLKELWNNNYPPA